MKEVSASELFPHREPLALPASGPPILVVVIDTEEEFDWHGPFARENVAVTAMRAQGPAQRLFERYGVTPTYAVTYPVATQVDGHRPLQELFASGACEIGAHLHPWVTPPFEEAVNGVNSMAGNLPAALERAKLTRLVEAIGSSFGHRPALYKAGRYGLGRNSAPLLEELGFTIDASVLPETDLRAKHGPDYRGYGCTPFRFGRQRRLLELPVTVGCIGPLARSAGARRHLLGRPALERLRIPGLLARARLLERITLTPEGVDHAAHRRLVRALLARGERIFTLTYHSPSLAPGHTPYVRSVADLIRFLDRIERFLAFFLGDLGGIARRATELAATLSDDPGRPEPDPLHRLACGAVQMPPHRKYS